MPNNEVHFGGWEIQTVDTCFDIRYYMMIIYVHENT